MAALAAERLEPPELAAVPVENRGAARHQKGGKEALLGAAVMRHIAVVIEMVPRQVRERRRGGRYAIQPELVEAVARGLDRHVVDAPLGQRSEFLVQHYRI